MGLGANARIISAPTLIIENNMYILVALALSLVRWFINDLPLAVKVDVVLFADDAAFVITCDTFHGLIDKIKE